MDWDTSSSRLHSIRCNPAVPPPRQRTPSNCDVITSPCRGHRMTSSPAKNSRRTIRVRRHDSIVGPTTNITSVPKRPDIISESNELRRRDDLEPSNDSGRTVVVEKTPLADNCSSSPVSRCFVSSHTERWKTGSRIRRSTSFPDLRSGARGGSDTDVGGVRGVDRTAYRSRIDHGVYQSYLAGVLQSSKRSDKFVRLRRMYSIVERITDIESELQYLRATAADDSSFHQHRHVERSPQDKARRHRGRLLFEELSHLYARLDVAYDEKEFFFNTGNDRLDKLRWKSWNDYGLVLRKTPLEDLRAVYSGMSSRDEHADRRTRTNDADVRQQPFTRLLTLFRKLDDRASGEQARRRYFQNQRQSSLVGESGSSNCSITGQSANRFDGTYMRIMELAARRSRERPMYGYHMDEYQHPYDKYVHSRRMCIPRSATNEFYDLTDDDDVSDRNVTQERLDAWSERRLRAGSRIRSLDDGVEDASTTASKRRNERSLHGSQVNADVRDVTECRSHDVNNNIGDGINNKNVIKSNSSTSRMLGVTERNRNMLLDDNRYTNHVRDRAADDLIGQKMSNQIDVIGDASDVTGDYVISTVSPCSSSLTLTTLEDKTMVSSNKDTSAEYEAEHALLPTVAPSAGNKSGCSMADNNDRTPNTGNRAEHGPRINVRAFRRPKEKWRRCSRPIPGTVNNVLTYLSSVNFDASCLNSRYNAKSSRTVTSGQTELTNECRDLQRSTDIVVSSAPSQPSSQRVADRDDDITPSSVDVFDNRRQVVSDATRWTSHPGYCDGRERVMTSSQDNTGIVSIELHPIGDSTLLSSDRYDGSDSTLSVDRGVRSTDRVECTVSDVVPAAIRRSSKIPRAPSGRSTPSDVTQHHRLQAVRPIYVTSPTYVTRPISVVSKKIEPTFIKSRCAAVRKLDRLSSSVTAVDEIDGVIEKSRTCQDSGMYSRHSPGGDTVFLSLTAVDPSGNSQSCSTSISTPTLRTTDRQVQSSISCSTNRNNNMKTLAKGTKLPAAVAKSGTLVHDCVINDNRFVTSFNLGDTSVPAWISNSTTAAPVLNVSVNSGLSMSFESGKKQSFTSSCDNSFEPRYELGDVSTVSSASGLSSVSCDITPVKHALSSGTRRLPVVEETVPSAVQGGSRTRRRSVAKDVVKSDVVDRSTASRQTVVGDNVESDIDDGGCGGGRRSHRRRRVRRQDSVLMSTMMNSLETISGEWARNGPRRSTTSPDPTITCQQQKDFADHVTATSSPLAVVNRIEEYKPIEDQEYQTPSVIPEWAHIAPSVTHGRVNGTPLSPGFTVNDEPWKEQQFQQQQVRQQKPKRPNSIQPFGSATALYPFTAQSKRELSFDRGDTIVLLKQIDRNWFEGQCHGATGVFPASYIEVNEIVDTLNGISLGEEGIATATYSFVAETHLELSFNKGDTITLLRRIDTNWYEARIDGRHGIVPLNHLFVSREPCDIRMTSYTGLGATADKSPYPRLTSSRPSDVSERRSSSVISNSMNGLQPEVTQQDISLSRYSPSHLVPEVNTVVTDDAASVSRYSANQQRRRSSRDHADIRASSSPQFYNALRSDDVTNSDRSNNSAEMRSTVGERHQPMTSRETVNQSVSGMQQSRNSSATDDERLRQAVTARSTERTGDRRPDRRLGHLPAVYRAAYNYRSRRPDELDLTVDDVIYVRDICDDGWFWGSSQRTNQFGSFPGNYVRPL